MRVLVSGYYGYGNRGDESLLAGLLGMLHELGATASVLSGDPAETSALHGVRAVHRYRGLPAALMRTDALISGGGGLLQDATSTRSLTYYLGVIRAARALGRRVLVFGQSLGPLSTAGRTRVAAALAGVPVAVRDGGSLELLAAMGLVGDLVADPALLLTPAGPPDPDAACDVLLVPRGPYHELTEMLGEAGRAAVTAGRSVALLAIQPAEDEPEIGRLEEMVPGARRLSAQDYRAALAATANAGLVLSARLHGLVFAVAAGRPHAGLVYDPKVRGFLERSGGPAFTAADGPAALVPLIHAPPSFDAAAAAGLMASAAAGQSWLAERLGR